MQGGGRRFDPGQLHHLEPQHDLDDLFDPSGGLPEERKSAGSVEAAAGGKPGLIDN